MRCPRWVTPVLSILTLALAQEDCPDTVTVTGRAPSSSASVSTGTAAPVVPGSSPISRQVITLTQVNTVIMTSNGMKIEKTQAVTNVLLVEDGRTLQATTSDSNRLHQATSCPPAVTVTLISQQTASATTTSNTAQTTTSSSAPTQPDTSTALTTTSAGELSSSVSTSSESGPTSTSTPTTPTTTSSSIQPTQSSEGPPTIPSPSPLTTPSSTTLSILHSNSSGNSTISQSRSSSASSSSSTALSILQSSSTGPTTTSSANTESNSTSGSSSSPNHTRSQSSTSLTSSPSTAQTTQTHSSSSQSTTQAPSSSSSPRSSNSPSTSVPSSLSSSSLEMSSSQPASSSSSSGSTDTSSKSSSGPFAPTSSSSPSDPPHLPTGSSTGPPSSTLQSVTVVSEVDPNLWKSHAPTITCKMPCSLSLPCVTLDKPTTVSAPPYTTSLCKQHCDGVDFRTMTTITFIAITASQVCFYALQAEAADVFTAAPNWFGGDGGMVDISAPAALSTCPPHWPSTDSGGKCGPDNNYLCPKKWCCGKNNKCGQGIDFCGDGCQLNWGYCWKNSTACKMPHFGKDNDDNHSVPIFPIWFDAPDPPDPPPSISIRPGDITFPPPPDQCAILGCKGDCGWLSCEGLAGWFVKLIRIPKLKCNIITKTFCRLLKLPCCKKKGGGGDTDCDFCDPPDGTTLNGEGKVCDPDMENCDDLPEEEAEDKCTKTSTATDKTVYCAMATAPGGKFSQTCTSTVSKVRSGCTIKPESTKTITSTGCKTTTVNHVSELCQVITGASTTRTHCPITVTKQASGCDYQPTTTSVLTTFCDEVTATHISELCSVATAANSTSTYCRSTQSRRVSGCDVTGSATSVFTTDCFSRTTVTDQTASCFALKATVVAGSTIVPSTTCTATASTVWSGCELTGSTTSVISTSFPVCAGSPQITLESMPTFASNLTESSATACGPPTSSGLPECTKIVIGQYVVTEAMGAISGSVVTARDDGASSTATLSCYCGPSAGADVWPVTVCDGESTWCPNKATTTREQTGTPTPPTLPATPM